MSIRPQYHFRPSPKGFFAWDVRKLVDASKGIAASDHPLSAIAELDELWWYAKPEDCPTPRSIAGHVELIQSVDLTFPVLLSADGRLMDGMHRCLKALIEGRDHVLARQFPVTPPPDFTDVQPEDLSYE